MSSKGQVVVPKDLRDKLGWSAGQSLNFEKKGDKLIVSSAKERERIFPKKTLEDVIGVLKYDGPPVTDEDIRLGIKRAIDEKWGKKQR